ncbi:hypothetical protein [Propionivibrio sp.]|uniref:hypothetical protein n=1 Tax=Propionivibrio sp. TaxID=2212460 RepID=UPI003BF13BF7
MRPHSDKISIALLACSLRHFATVLPEPAKPEKLVAMRSPFSLVDFSIILALGIVAVVGYKYSPLLLAKADVTIEPVAGCDLHKQACLAEIPGGGRIELSITPHPIPVVQPLQVSVTISGVVANKVEIDFAGVTMNMGYNRRALSADGNGRYASEAMLPVCITGRMLWRATLVLETGRQRIAVPFLFEAPVQGG